MSVPDLCRSAAVRGLGRTLEDQLHRTRDQLCLVADLFDLQAVTPEASSDGLSAAACAALREVYRQASHELRMTLDALPVALLDVELDGEASPPPVEGERQGPSAQGATPQRTGAPTTTSDSTGVRRSGAGSRLGGVSAVAMVPRATSCRWARGATDPGVSSRATHVQVAGATAALAGQHDDPLSWRGHP